MKKIILALALMYTINNVNSLYAAEAKSDWDTAPSALELKNTAAHETARSIEKYFGATCRALRAMGIWYLFSDVALGEPDYINRAPIGWRYARNFDMSWLGIPGNVPVDIFMGTASASKLRLIGKIAGRVAVGYGVAAVVYTAHELGHAAARYLLTGVKSTVYIGSPWAATLGLLKDGEKPAPLFSCCNGRFVVRGSCLNGGSANADIDTERMGPGPTAKGLAISMAGGICGILAAKSIKGVGYLLRHKKEFKANKLRTIRKALWHCCTLDNCTLFNLYNMFYPLYGLDSYYFWWYSAYKAQKTPTAADLKTETLTTK